MMKHSTYTSYDELPLMLSVAEVAAVLGISRAGAYELFYPQIGVKPCSMAGGGVSKNIWNCFRTAPEGTGQPLTCSTSGMGLRLK